MSTYLFKIEHGQLYPYTYNIIYRNGIIIQKHDIIIITTVFLVLLLLVPNKYNKLQIRKALYLK